MKLYIHVLARPAREIRKNTNRLNGGVQLWPILTANVEIGKVAVAEVDRS